MAIQAEAIKLKSPLGGGLTYRYVGPLSPFFTTFGLLVFATIFGALFLPNIPPVQHTDPEKPQKGVFEPLKIFIPRKRMINGRMRWDFNLSFLGAGAFFSVFATGYVPMGLQLIATNVFGFQPAESGFMLVRACPDERKDPNSHASR